MLDQRGLVMDFANIAMNFGIAAACLAALGLGVWRAIIFLATFVLLPVTNRHIKFLDDLTAAMTSQSQALQTMSVQQGKNLEGIQEILSAMKAILSQQEELIRTVTEVHAKVAKDGR